MQQRSAYDYFRLTVSIGTKSRYQAEEQITSDYLLKVFRASIPGMSKTASKFAHELQSVLQQMLMKPTGPNWLAVSVMHITALLPRLVRDPDFAGNRLLHLYRCSPSHT
jgi:hypothetical protein